MIDLVGKTILVTGASRGIGRAIALRLSEAGAQVLLHYGANREAAEEAAQAAGLPLTHCLQADLTQDRAGSALFAQALNCTGRIDGLVNNAGIFEAAGSFSGDDVWHRVWQRSWAVNVQAVADLSRAALRHYRETGGGRIVTIASRAAHRGDGAEYPAYAASKGAVVAMMKTFARAYARDGVLVYTIAPGWVATDMAPSDDQALAQIQAEVPLGVMAEPDEIGALTAFLLSDLCRSATGATFDVNGASYVR